MIETIPTGNSIIHHRRNFTIIDSNNEVNYDNNNNNHHSVLTKRTPMIVARGLSHNNNTSFHKNDDNDISSKERSHHNSTRKSSSSSTLVIIISILTHLVLSVITFHIGFVMGGNYGCSMMGHNSNEERHMTSMMYHNLLSNLFPLTSSNGLMNDPTTHIPTTQKKEDDTKQTMMTPIFPKTILNVLYGAATVRRDNFIEQYDVGVPWNEPKHGATDVLVIYQSTHSLPSDYRKKDTTTMFIDDEMGNTLTNTTTTTTTTLTNSPIRVSYDSALEATTNCHTMKVILIEPNTKHECIAIVPQWESFHIQHYLRIKPENSTTTKTKTFRKDKHLQSVIPHFQKEYPLRLVSRHDSLTGKSKPRIPVAYQSKKYWFLLLDYLTKLSSTLERLKPIAETVVTSSNNYHHSATIVVMVCNFGQSELFINFVCSARARDIDLSNVLLFATDTDMYTLAQSLHIATFDVQDAFGDMPTGAARVYGDRVFQGMMLSKVYCVHLISTLGYDVLFQDVDVVWYRNPIEYFQSEQSGDFDFYFQDDGAHSTRYTPYSPNSGFYYVRNNDRTRYFFEVFMRIGDQIMASGSHQSVMNTLLADQSSSTGLRVKVFERDSYLGQEFPGGFHYHKRREFMRTVVEGKRSPYIFHMSWTENKNNKQKFYQQLGDWFVNDQCINKKHEELEIAEDAHFASHCCSAQPIMKCHYADKPSKTSCKGSPLIDKRGKSFW